MADLIALEDAKAHLRVTSDREDADITNKLLAAQQVILDYLTRRDTAWNDEMAAWTEDTVPASVKAAILVQLGELRRNRGDEAEIRPQGPTALSPTVMSLLMRYRDPGLA